MANKEPKNIKRFPKRFLSSLRRGKKFHPPAGKNEPCLDSDERAGFTSYDMENTKNENATIDLEASIVLTTPRKRNNSDRGSINALVTPKRSLRSALHVDSHDLSHNLSPPQVERLVFGGPMSASTDSGIDCSILLSERNSPEQFVAFTRREAERLRQEQLHNASVLETLNETDQSCSDDCDTDHVNADADCVNGDTDHVNGDADHVNGDASIVTGVGKVSKECNEQLIGLEGATGIDETAFKVVYQSCDTLPSSPPPPCIGASGTELIDTQTSDENQQNSHDLSSSNLSKFGGDYVLLSENVNHSSPIVDVTSIICDNMKRINEAEQSEAVGRDLGVNYSQNLPCNMLEMKEIPASVTSSETVTSDQLSINTDKSYLHYYANRTDEIKSAEARFRNEQMPGSSLHLSVSHDIVNPVPIVTPSVATHRVLQSTPSPARLYVNENSAFAKCKSLKRSVSDVGKGILGRFRHRSKDNRVQKDGDIDGEKSGNTKQKKLGAKKGKQMSRTRHSSEKAGKVSTDSVSYSQVKYKKKQSLKSPVTKEILPSNGEMGNDCRGNTGHPKQSPIYKEILNDNVKEELEASFNRKCSPVMMESIQDLTTSISKMTSALCASSAESIACICDCKNRFSDPECCEKRKTPSPFGSTDCNDHCKTPPPFKDSEYYELSQSDCKATSEIVYNERTACATLENEITEYSPLIDQSNTQKNKQKHLHEANDLFCDGDDDDSCDESCDECYSDSDDDDGECSDLDCSNCCNVSPNTGNVDLLSGSSSSGSECSLKDLCENLTMSKKRTLGSELRNSESSSQSSGSPSFTCMSNQSAQNQESSSQSSNSSGSSSPVIDDSSFNMDESSFSVSFKEIDFENGDVMYIENNLGDDFIKDEMPESDDCLKLSTVCATPASSPRVYGDASQENSPCMTLFNTHVNNISNSSQNTNFLNSPGQNRYLSQQLVQKHSSSSCVKVRSDEKNGNFTDSPSSSVETSPTPLNLSQSSSFTNVSFEGSFADISLLVHNRSERSREKKSTENSLITNLENSFIHEQTSGDTINKNVIDNSYINSLNESISGHEFNHSRYKSKRVNPGYNASLSSLNDSRLLQRTLRRNHNNSLSCMNETRILNDSRLQHNRRIGSSNRDFRQRQNHYRNSLNSSNLSFSQLNESFDRFNTSRSSYHGLSESPMSSPLDLSINKGKEATLDRSMSMRSDKHWVDRHVGQVYSPAKRVLHKNSGLSESDLCKQILDLYVSDADESGFNLNENDLSLNESSLNTSQDCSMVNASVEGFPSANFEDSSNDEERPGLQYGTYVAPRNVVKETNVDDFTTTTVWTCYTGEAKTRKLQGKSGSTHLRGEDRRRAALNELQNMTMEKTSSKKAEPVSESPAKNGKIRGREALLDQTNTKRRLSSLDMPPSLNEGISTEGVKQEIKETSKKTRNMNDKNFDHLTLLHTAQNGQRRVRCLTMDESQSVVKYYPPPKEASRISWGQTISELDLYRHTPRKTPVKTRPILNQKENSYPFEDDSPSPIVLTKMRKPKSLAKKYKNWPWS